jgi:hypothetical protein
VSVGADGSLTLHLATPVTDSTHPYGIDFIIFGNSFFTITNGNFSGGGITSGVLGGNNTGSTRVEVSADGLNWYGLSLSLVPIVDAAFPTDGSGNPLIAVNPPLGEAHFAGLGLSGIRSRHNGSAGGTGFDLSWARDGDGSSVALLSASFLRIGGWRWESVRRSPARVPARYQRGAALDATAPTFDPLRPRQQETAVEPGTWDLELPPPSLILRADEQALLHHDGD